MIINLSLIFLFSISFIGIILLRYSIWEKRSFIFIPAGMMWGACIYIFLLNIISKIFPGILGIIVSTLLLAMLGVVGLVRNIPKFQKPSSLLSFLIIIGLIFATFYLARLKMTSVFPVADADMQWAYAATFARGNHPIKAPWQPDFSPHYHLGAYFLEGALLAIFNLPLITINAILNTFYLSAGFLFSIFIFWENKYAFKNIWNILSGLILYISYGVVIFVIPGQNFLRFDTLSYLIKYPQDIIAKGAAGASLVDLNSLSYLPARSLGLGLSFLAFYFTFAEFKNSKNKVIFFVLLFSVLALVEESVFLPILGVTIGLSLLTFIPFSQFGFFKKERSILFKILVFSAIIIFLQGGFFSELFNHNKSFHINLPFLNSSFLSQLEKLNNSVIQYSNLSWIILSPLFFILVLLIYALRIQYNALVILALYSLSAFTCFLLIEYKYYPSNNIRFFNLGYISAGIGFIYLLFAILKSQSFKKNVLIFSFFTPFVLIPTVLPEILNQYDQIKEAKSKNSRSQILINSNPNTPFEQTGNWANKFLPSNIRLVSLDTDLPTPLRSIQFEFKGLYTTLGPQYTRVLRQEPGPEYFDLILTLNPSILKQTKTEYVYIESESLAYKQLPQFRKHDLNNAKYFKLLKSSDIKDGSGKNIFYRLYKVLPAYFDQVNLVKEIDETTLETLEKLIPDNKSIYITDYGNDDELSFFYRMVLVLTLKDKDIRRNLSQTDYMVVETTIPYKNGFLDEKYDFYILSPSQKPPYPAKLIWSNIYAACWQVL